MRHGEHAEEEIARRDQCDRFEPAPTAGASGIYPAPPAGAIVRDQAIASDGSNIDPRLKPIVRRLAAPGYEGAHMPMTCQRGAVDALGAQPAGDQAAACGVGVRVATRSSAEDLAGLWDGSSLGIVGGHVLRDFNTIARLPGDHAAPLASSVVERRGAGGA